MRPGAPAALPERLLVVDAERQVATLFECGEAVAAWPVSTARTGIGGEENSFRTPPGWHRIHARIGESAAPGTVFVSREPTGETWRGEACDDDLILTRILTLDGLEDGVNRGPGCDSLARYIYLHGTNHEQSLGRPALAWLRAPVERRCAGAVRAACAKAIWCSSPRPMRDDPRSAGRRPLSLRGARRRRHERARPVPGDDRGTRERQRSSLRPRRARGLARPARTPRHRRAAAGRERARVRLRGARRLDRRRRYTCRTVAAARANDIPIIHRSELLAHFVARLSLDRGHRHERQIDGHGDDVRHSEGRRPRSLGDHRRRSAGA